jgi:hypothetical protein
LNKAVTLPLLALLGPWEMSDLSPQSGPKRNIDQMAVTNRHFMSIGMLAMGNPAAQPDGATELAGVTALK